MPIVGARYRSKSAELSHEVATLSMSTTATTTSSGLGMETVGSTRTALVIDGSYAMIGARDLGGKIDYIKLRAALEEQASTQFGDCWFFDQNPSVQRLNPALIAEYHMLKFAPPDGPQVLQLNLLGMMLRGLMVWKLQLLKVPGDGDFYSSLSHVRNVLRKDIWVIGADMNGQGHAKRGARGDTSKQADDAPVFTLSDISSDDEDVGGKPFPLSLPVPLRSAAPVMTAQDHDAMLDEIGGRTEVIDLASETESE
ncbi:hypothetical protein AM587_10015879 [Phytophthora nicotianae]|uniref:Uncharacterized protein n=1 Tax=Phytophthora nicotianae TaxID=4792 RepID=A0A0W8BVA7_PHYNI|nr:hypothetical protein AM587_10016574 [Phytophthora nicotianae]KUG01195.1 hypothetical protein AM587_10015879 [Phytophthora nicotianae]